MFKELLLAKYSVKEQESEAFKKGMTNAEIPNEYKHLPIIGRGNTSIILEKDPKTVIMLTRDSMKKDWLHFGLNLTEDWKTHEVPVHFKRTSFEDFPVFAITLPKLRKPTGSNVKKIKEEIKLYHKNIKDLNISYSDLKRNISLIVEKYYEEGNDDSLILKVLEWLQNYNEDQYTMDIAARQFLEDMDGNLILIDPIVTSTLLHTMFEIKKAA